MEKETEMTNVDSVQSSHEREEKVNSATCFEIQSERPLHREAPPAIMPPSLLKEHSVKGRITMYVEASMRVGDIVAYTDIETHKIWVYNAEYSGLWDYLLGYCSRQVFLHEGHIYLLKPLSNEKIVDAVYSLVHLFKVFVDLQEDVVRLVMVDNNKINTLDFEPQKINVFLREFNKYIQSHGIHLS